MVQSEGSPEEIQLQAHNKQLADELAALQQRLRGIENRDLPVYEQEKQALAEELAAAKQLLDEVCGERDCLKNNLGKLERRQEVEQLARHCRFSDAGYFDFLMREENINYKNPQEMETFVEKLQEKSPKLFIPDLRSGSGSAPAAESASHADCGDLLGMLRHAPDFE